VIVNVADVGVGSAFTEAALADAMRRSGTTRMRNCPTAEVLLADLAEAGVVVQVDDDLYRLTAKGMRLARGVL
jgi:hypothetical protein